jgi:hypothetical protein
MDTFDHLLNWKLKRGSHAFPGPDGGTCINGAALVAAGFEYRPVSDVRQMPECFSRPICELAMVLNDQATDEERQRLLPYVTRLACADTPEVERTRAAYIDRHALYCYTGVHSFGVFIITSFEGDLKVLDGALAIGRQADPLIPQEVQGRMEQVKAEAPAPLAPPERPFFAKVKSWLTMKEMEPDA